MSKRAPIPVNFSGDVLNDIDGLDLVTYVIMVIEEYQDADKYLNGLGVEGTRDVRHLTLKERIEICLQQQ